MPTPGPRRALATHGAPSTPLLVVLALLLARPASGVEPAATPIALQENDVICEIGNGLADRMQHDGWVETLIQSRFVGKKLSFRDLAISGDTVGGRPRQEGFASPEDYLKLCKADVIFVYFGYNESFGGQAGVAQFKNELGAMIDRYRGVNFNGRSAPRIVLFAPIAHEDLHTANLPDGAADNVNLALYTAAIAQVAEEKKAPFVDLFGASQVLYVQARAPLTLNGVHLLPDGDRQIGQVIASAITGQAVTSTAALEPLRQAVLDKDAHWFRRYRAVRRQRHLGQPLRAEFVNDQTNADVLTHELAMLDVMTANRDARIWAVAAGKDKKVDDGNVPKPVPVISNVGGGSKSPSPAGKEGR